LRDQRGVSLVPVGGKSAERNSSIIRLAELGGQHLIAEQQYVRALAAVIVRAELGEGWDECRHEMVEPGRIGADKFKYALLGICQRDQCAAVAQRFHDAPLIRTRILEFIEDDARVSGGRQRAQLHGTFEQACYEIGEQIEADLALNEREPVALGLLAGSLLRQRAIVELVVGAIFSPDRG
jgi:hypothetical protein